MELIIESTKHGKHLVVFDDDEWDVINKYKWRPRVVRHTVYAVSYIYKPEKKNNISIFMHNVIMNHIGVDHINGNGLDNRKANLRVATQSQNSKNTKVKSTNKYGLKGVSYDKNKKAYVAFITVEYKHIFLGYFISLIDAALAYNKAAIEHFKEFARLNIISKKQEEEYRKLDLPNRKSRGKNKGFKKGVSISDGKYMARKTHKGKTYYIGTFDTEDEAANAYNNFNV